MNYTAIARLAAEGGLLTGTITGGAYAVKYGKQVVETDKAKTEVEAAKKKIEEENAKNLSDANDATSELALIMDVIYPLNMYMTDDSSVDEDKASDKQSLKQSIKEWNECIKKYSDSRGAKWDKDYQCSSDPTKKQGDISKQIKDLLKKIKKEYYLSAE